MARTVHYDTDETINLKDTVRLKWWVSKGREASFTWRVVEIRPRAKSCVVIEVVDNPHHRLAVEPAMIDKADADGTVVKIVPLLPTLWPGAVVTVTAEGRRYVKVDEGQRFVVLREKRDDKVSIAKLGGDEGRYWPSIPRQFLEIVEL